MDIKVYLVTFCLLLFTYLTSSMQIKHAFRDPKDNYLQHIIVHKKSGEIIIGAKNTLRKLSSDLTLIDSAIIGPKLDNPYCPPPQVPCDRNKTWTNSFSQGLVIDYDVDSLISCSSLYHGFCQIRSFKNITHIWKDVSKPIVSNYPSVPSFMFVGKGINSSNVLYIGTKYSSFGLESYRDLVPHISSRILDTLEFAYRDSKGGTKISVLKSSRSEILAEFVYGFTYGKFVYFITSQRNPNSPDTYESKLIRICQNDKYFRSYMEIPVDCTSIQNGIVFNVAKGGYFDNKTGKLYVNYEHTQMNSIGPSAVCAYNMVETQEMFDLTVSECFHGDGKLGPAHIHKPQPCNRTNENPDFCGHSEESKNHYPIDGQNTIHQISLIEFPSTVLTSVLVTQSGQNDVLFLGTTDGEVKKVVISPGKQVTVVKEIEIDPGETIKDLQFSPDKTHLYALTMNKVVKINTQHCDERTTCEECTADSDPVCGWCVMENRCVERDMCPTSPLSPHWLPSKKGACAKMVEVQPKYLSYESIESNQQGQQISFKLEEIMLLPLNSNIELHCAFTATSKTMATVQNEVVSCPLPGRHELPIIPKDHHDLEIEFHVGGRPIVKRSVSVFDCRGHTRCTDCTQSNFTCEWHYDSNTCVSGTTNAASRQTSPGISNPDQCPRIESQSGSTDIVVHSGESKQIAVRIASLQTGQSDNVKCRFKYLGNATVVSATMSTSSRLVECDPVKFEFQDERPYVVADFDVTWGQQDFSLDNPRGISVRIYKCPSMVLNCGQCLSMDAEYECGWCEDRCTLQKHCTQKQWQDRTDVCANPQILRFSPSSGPINGKTNISVTGINLGKTYNDIQNGVTVAGINCIVHPEHYEPSTRFKCETELSPNVKSGTIKIKVSNQYDAESDSNFSFVDPQVFYILPVKGPKSGGTLVIISGDKMNAGTKVTVDIGGSPCPVIKYNSSMIECKTTQQVSGDDLVEVEVSFGGYKRLAANRFTYKDDPTIARIEPMKSIVSGGVTLSVVGERLDLIQKPEFFIEIGDKEFKSECLHDSLRLDNSIMISSLKCRTPPLMLQGENVTDTNPKEVHFGFNLDGVMTWRNISRHNNMGPLLYYPDPEVEVFTNKNGVKQYKKDERLVIMGKFRSVNPILQDVKIMVGQADCESIEATDTAVSCSPPDKPAGINGQGNALVQIKVGNLQQDVGFLQYYVNEDEEKPITFGIILGVVLPIIAIIILLTICIIRRQRKHGPAEQGIPDVLKDYEGKKEDEEMGLNNVSVKADMNGQIPDNIDSGPYISSLLDRIQDEATRQSISNFLIPRSKLDIGELIGKGMFGNTYEAQYNCEEGDGEPKAVAVKALQGCNTDNDTIVTFLHHCATLKDLQHPNVLPMLGVCLTAAEEPLLVRPHLQRGDLKAYVRDPAKNITVLELLEFANQIAEAMMYLEGLHIVHRNLAARNCLISDDKVVRVSDYGFTQLFSPEYYNGEENRAKQTIKWLAPESIGNFQFTAKTDVWSYGVLLWELLTRGVTPYPDIEASDLKDYLNGGHRLKKPRQCPESLYLLMLKCWTDNPVDRPTFQEVSAELKQFIQSEDDSDSVTQPLTTNIELGGSTEYVEVAE